MRLSFSKVAPLIGGAVLAGLATTASAQSLSIDLRILTAGGVAPNGGTVTAKAASIAIGQTVVMAVYADVVGASYATIQAAQGSFTSTGAGRGNLTAGRAAPFNASGSTNGTVTDLDGDGDNDVTGYAARAAQLTGPDNSGVTYLTTPQPLNGGTGYEYRIGTATFIGTANGLTTVNFIPNVGGTASTYFTGTTRNSYDDGGGGTTVTYGFDGNAPDPTSTSGGAQGSLFTSTAGPAITVGVPEPTSIGLLGLAGAGLVARRRKA